MVFKQVIYKNNYRIIYQKIKTITGLALVIFLIELGHLINQKYLVNNHADFFQRICYDGSRRLLSKNLIYLNPSTTYNSVLDADEPGEVEESFIDAAEEKLIFWWLKQPEFIFIVQFNIFMVKFCYFIWANFSYIK